MLTHKYQNWYTELVGLSTWQWYGILAVALLLAGLSVIKPQFFYLLGANTLKQMWRSIKGWFRRSKKTAGEGGVSICGVYFPDSARVRHTDVSGSPGGGKTVLFEQLIFHDISRGYGMLIIDPKGDRSLYNRVKAYCAEIGRERHLHYLSATRPEESVRWNPCSLGDASSLQSKWFNSGVYAEPFYAKACEIALLRAFNTLMIDKPKHFTIKDLVKQLETQAEDSKKDNIQGLCMEIQAFAESEWGPVLGMPQGVTGRKQPVVSLLDTMMRNEILFVDLPIQAKALQSGRAGKLLLQEVMLVSGLRMLHPELKSAFPFSVYVDEFASFATESFATFMSMARSSDLMIHIAHQTIADLERVSKPFKEIVMGLANNRFVFRQDNSNDAEEWSRYFGTKKVTRKTYRTSSGLETGESSNRETEEFNIHPNVIKNLRVGECIFSMKTERVLEKLKLPFPPIRPKRRGGIIEREWPRDEETVHTPGGGSPEKFNKKTDEQATLLDDARKQGEELVQKDPKKSMPKPVRTRKTKPVLSLQVTNPAENAEKDLE
jgi:hypothetical protein